MLENQLLGLAANRDQLDAQRITINEMLRTKAIEARQAGWSANRIAELVGVSKRTIQLWTDDHR